MFGNDRQGYRQYFLNCRKKQLAGAPLEPLEQLIVRVIEQHPEYHPLLDGGEKALERDFHPALGEMNPFFHLGLHISLAEQLGTDRPAGIRSLYQAVRQKLGSDAHATDHLFMECLSDTLSQAQSQGRPPDEDSYLAAVRSRMGLA